VQDTAIDEITKAGKEEREIAIKNGNVDENGIPMCTVIADGQWSKRSYKTKYNSFSGAVKNVKKKIFQINLIQFYFRRLLLDSTQKKYYLLVCVIVTVLFVSEQQTEKLSHLFTFVSLIGKSHPPPWKRIVYWKGFPIV